MIREACYKITENCPCNCTFCDSNEKYEKIFNKCNINLEQWKNITDKLLIEGLEVVVLSGGEPLLQEEITFELIHYLKKNGVYVVLNTSGVLFENNELLKRVKENYPNLLVFSVDSSVAQEHDENRNMKGLFERVENSIRNLKSSGNFPVAIRTVITKKNYKQIPDIITKFNNMGIDCIKLTNIEDDIEGKFRLSLDEINYFDNYVRKEIIDALKKCSYTNREYISDNIRKIENLFQKDGKVNYSDLAQGHFSPYLIGNAKCDLNGHFFSIECNGIVLPCCEAEHHYSPILGNLLNMTVKEIKESEEYDNFIKNRLDYCITCTQSHNLQINFTNQGTKVNRR